HHACSRRRVRRTRGWWWSWLLVAVVVVRVVGATDEVDGPSQSGGGVGRGRKRPSPPIEIRRVELWREPMPPLRLHTAGPLKPRVERVDGDRGGSPRLVVDVPAPVAARAAETIGGAGVVRQVRVERLGRQATRIVVELAEAVPYRVRQDD